MAVAEGLPVRMRFEQLQHTVICHWIKQATYSRMGSSAEILKSRRWRDGSQFRLRQ